MEIKIDIPQNEYKVPTEVRQCVVQAICDNMLRGIILHPKQDGIYRKPNIYITEDGKLAEYDWKGRNFPIHGIEFKTAFKALRAAKYHIFRVFEYGNWSGYKCSPKPFIDDGMEVEEFREFID